MRNILIFFGLFIIMHSCVIPSIHPLYTEEDLIIDERLIGIWGEEDDEATWDFKLASERRGSDLFDYMDYPSEKSLSLIYREKNKSAEFNAHMIKLGDNYYLDFLPYEYEIDNGLLDIHLMPVHTFARIKIENNRITLEMFDPDWLKDLLDKNKIRIKHEYQSELKIYVLTASTRSLQKFIEKYGNDPEAYSDPLFLVRN